MEDTYTSMNYYPFHIGDYAAATRHLSWDEDSAYRRLLDLYYSSEKPIPLDERATFRLVMATTDSQREAVRVVLAEFFDRADSGWVNKRADEEIAAMREKQQKQRDKANSMWARRRAALGTSTTPEHGNAPAMPRHATGDAAASVSDADAMPPTPTPTPTPKRKATTSADALTVEALCGDGLTAQTAGEFLAHRRAKGAKLTARAWQGVVSEAAKAGWPVEQAVCKALARGWTGFEASWVANETRPASQSLVDPFVGAH